MSYDVLLGLAGGMVMAKDDVADDFVERVVTHESGWSALWKVLKEYKEPDVVIRVPAPELGAAQVSLRASVLQRIQREHPELWIEPVIEYRPC